MMTKLKSAVAVRWSDFVRRIWLRTVRKQLWKCAHNLVMLGQINGDIQPDIDAAKDALYRAVIKLDKKDSPNAPLQASGCWAASNRKQR